MGTVWLGLTVGCAQCHDHKYDPITQKDFYRLMAFFENGDEVDIEAPLPGEWGIYRQYAKEFRQQRDKLLKEYKIADTLAFWEDGVRDALANPGRRPNWDVSYDSFSKGVDHGRRTLLKKPSERTGREQDALVDYFVQSLSGAIGKEKYEALKLKELGEKLKKLDEKYPRLSTAMTLEEGSQRLPTHVRIRGNWAEKGEEVTPGTPASLPPLKEGSDRLALAKWLVSRENPLTARVTVNRLWQELFGRGLVSHSRRLRRAKRKADASGTARLARLPNSWIAAGASSTLCGSSLRLPHIARSSDARPDLATIDPAEYAACPAVTLPASRRTDSRLRPAGQRASE